MANTRSKDIELSTYMPLIKVPTSGRVRPTSVTIPADYIKRSRFCDDNVLKTSFESAEYSCPGKLYDLIRLYTVAVQRYCDTVLIHHFLQDVQHVNPAYKDTIERVFVPADGYFNRENGQLYYTSPSSPKRIVLPILSESRVLYFQDSDSSPRPISCVLSEKTKNPVSMTSHGLIPKSRQLLHMNHLR
ncbi:hypothetical protein GEMRC1_010068 [Eukaryota sp. GEM-RC1]